MYIPVHSCTNAALKRWFIALSGRNIFESSAKIACIERKLSSFFPKKPHRSITIYSNPFTSKNFMIRNRYVKLQHFKYT